MITWQSVAPAPATLAVPAPHTPPLRQESRFLWRERLNWRVEAGRIVGLACYRNSSWEVVVVEQIPVSHLLSLFLRCYPTVIGGVWDRRIVSRARARASSYSFQRVHRTTLPGRVPASIPQGYGESHLAGCYGR